MSNPESFLSSLAEQGIILDQDERAQLIHEQVEKLAHEIGGQAVIEADLLNEVTNLVEAPLGMRGSFEDRKSVV